MQARTITESHPFKRNWLACAMAALLATSAFAVAPQAQARVFVSVNIAPPILPVYEQPPIPGYGYIWTPGFWAYDEDGGYYWVPGTWVRPPYSGALWTPGYWGWSGSVYVFNRGYWGRHVGYYGGINYGYGYFGSGYGGGYWRANHFYYNRAYNRFGNVRITNVYNRTIIHNTTVNRYSFNGPGGVTYRATAQERAAARERHVGPVAGQVRQREFARHDKSLRASVNHGAPPIMATPRAGVFSRTSHANVAGTNGAAHANAHAAFGQRTAATARTLGRNPAARATFGADQSAAAKAKQRPKHVSTHAMRGESHAATRNVHVQKPHERRSDAYSGDHRSNRGMRSGPRIQQYPARESRQYHQVPRRQDQAPRGHNPRDAASGKPDHHGHGG